jgi:DNA-binding Lrp family transcriptional regulator
MDRPPELADKLIAALQQSVPLVPRPWAQLARDLGSDEQAVIDCVRQLRGPGGLIREISGIFDAERLGYRVSLAAMRLDSTKLDVAGQVVAAHPGVSHAYARRDDWNLWLTLAVAPGAPRDIDQELAALAGSCGAAGHMLLPAVKRYKLHVRFGPGARANSQPSDASPRSAASALPLPPSPAQIAAIRALQCDLPTEAEPFEPLARQAGLSQDELLAAGRHFLAAGWMRRYAAVLYHRRAGASANVMVAWRAESIARADLAGEVCRSIPAISHCYLRATTPDWPWDFYTMIHGRDEADCRATIGKIASAAPLASPRELWTVREFAKRRVELLPR